MKVKKLRN